MSWSREEALTDPAVREPMIFVSEFRFHLRDIPTEIVMRLYRPLQSGPIVIRRSHDLSIPQLTKVPAASAPRMEENAPDSEGEALHGAVDELIRTYNAACDQGLTPSPDWLKANKDFS